eukprot:7342732-Alexandrium_andersonii.AAC.1
MLARVDLPGKEAVVVVGAGVAIAALVTLRPGACAPRSGRGLQGAGGPKPELQHDAGAHSARLPVCRPRWCPTAPARAAHMPAAR